MSVVQPVLATELVFVLVLCQVWIRQDVARAAWAGVPAQVPDRTGCGVQHSHR
jgi:hypothetical protein